MNRAAAAARSRPAAIGGALFVDEQIDVRADLLVEVLFDPSSAEDGSQEARDA